MEILNVEKSCTKISQVKQAKSLSFLTTKISKLINRKHRAWNHYRKNKTTENYLVFKSFCNQTTHQIQVLKRRFEEKLAEEVKVNPKSFWRYATQKCSSRRTIPDILHDSKSVADPELKIEIFNQYFSSVFFVQPQYCISYTSLI